MNFEDEFRKFSVKTKNRTKDRSHLYADLAEIIALILNANYLTMVDFILRFRKENLRLVFDDEEENEEMDHDEIGSKNAEANDAEEMRALEVFEQLEARSRVFSDGYPFDVESGKIKLREHISNKQRLYLFLLICSNLDFVSKKLSYVLTKDFEIVSKVALKTYLLNLENIVSFGKNSDYAGDTKSKILDLGRQLRLKVIAENVENVEGQGDSDGGLDLVAWLPFSDSFTNFVAVLGQCACGKNWHEKQGETRRFDGSYFEFNYLKPIHAMFVPFGLILEEKVFERRFLIQETLLIERTRIMELVADKSEFVADLSSNQLIQRLIEFEDTLY